MWLRMVRMKTGRCDIGRISAYKASTRPTLLNWCEIVYQGCCLVISRTADSTGELARHSCLSTPTLEVVHREERTPHTVCPQPHSRVKHVPPFTPRGRNKRREKYGCIFTAVTNKPRAAQGPRRTRRERRPASIVSTQLTSTVPCGSRYYCRREIETTPKT